MSLTTRRLRHALFYIFAVLTVGRVHAGTATSITGLYTTGQDMHLEEWWKLVDDHWTTSNADAKAYVLWTTPSGWANPGSGAWISASPTGYPGTSVSYSYALTFNIAGTGTGAAGNAAITLSLYVDDTAVVLVNGIQVAVVSGGDRYTTPTTLVLSSNFVIGSNTISIVVNNANGASGLLVSSITGVVPEVGVWLPLAGAFGAVLWLRLRRRRKLPLAA